ncbi:interleukin-12 receptor subunit beta-2 isoform X2 [Anguilla anguilla]|uniref:interleukin-12 receptor subunit beta-2 isoform X2 n=1 Tax=Anguilla anguilla TaxID=7936 RepID=UPI0015B1EE7A|nr:interleukin-12 receptor subunit beta-2 isoform X2 [Anguilla anguilla]
MTSLCAGLPALTLVTLLCGVPAATAGEQCTAYSEVGKVVQLGSSFRIYCNFSTNPCHGRRSIHINRKEVNSRIDHNATISSFQVTNITENRVFFTCKCTTSSKNPRLCGIDVDAGYAPWTPQNLTCIQKEGSGNVTCSWKKGRETHLPTISEFWLRTLAPDGTAMVSSILGSGSVTFPILEPQGSYSVWVKETNQLGSAVSSSLNFSLNDIVMPLPPEINGVDCSSRHCVLHWDRGQGPLRMEVQYRAVQETWTTHRFTAKGNRTWGINDLEPFMLYEIRARCKLMPERGVWSEWSTVLTTRTDEEVPRTKLDIWYTEQSPKSQNTSLTVLWKELNKSEAGGRILGYRLEVHDLQQGSTRVYTTNSSAGWPIACTRCNVTLSTYNSKGHSPPACMTLPLHTDLPAFAPQNVLCMPNSNSSIAISWQKPATAGHVSGYLVEWCPAKRGKQGLKWKRINPDQLSTVITENIHPGECYQGAVYALYKDRIAGKTSFLDVFSLESAPTQGPTPSVNVGDGRVTVTWTEIPLEHQRGCLKRYTIYLERARDRTIQKYGPIDPSLRSYSAFSGLHPGERYNLSMTGSTTAGEGRRGKTVVFFYPRHKQQDQQVFYVIIFAGCTLFLCVLVVMSLCQISSVRKRVSMCFFCSMPDVPDPANSKWAKECAAIKGLMLDNQFSLDDSSQSEEEPHTLEIQEFPMSWDLANPELSRTSDPDGGTTDLCLLLPPNHSPSQASPLYDGQLTFSYIKSFSHDSDSSEQTQESKGTDVTVDYISPQGLLADSSEVEAENDCLGDMNFFPCPQSPFLEPMFQCGGKLTLDAVKIDCSFLD